MVYGAASVLCPGGGIPVGRTVEDSGRHGTWVRRFGDRSSERFLGLAAIILIFPAEVGSRLAFYGETLLPNSSAYEAGYRAWDYPIHNLMLAFTNPNWVMGNGIGLASLGSQYVSKLLGQPPFTLWVEEGYGQLIIEMGIVAPFLWIAWTAALLYSMWQVLRGLRQTRFFPIGFAIFWYAFLLLYPFTYGGLVALSKLCR